MKEEKKIVTLIGVGQAVVGKEFIHNGSGSKCEACKYFQVCVKNLEPERIYRVVKVRENVLSCNLYKINMQAVEVVEAEVSVAVSSKQAIQNAIMTLRMPECGGQDCENYDLCFPRGLKRGDRCEIVAVGESLKCSQGSSLVKVLLRRVPAS